MVLKVCSVEPLGTLEAGKGTRGVFWVEVGMSSKVAPFMSVMYIFELYRKLDLEKRFLTLSFKKH